jgi:hypothetical protein
VSLRVRLVITLLFSGLGVWAANETLSFPITGRLMPLLASVLLALLSALHAVNLGLELRRESSKAPAAAVPDRAVPGEKKSTGGALGEGHMQNLPPLSASARYLVGWIMASLILISVLGTWVGGLIFLAAFVFVELPENRRFLVLIAPLTLGVAAALVVLLGIDVPQGIIFGSGR